MPRTEKVGLIAKFNDEGRCVDVEFEVNEGSELTLDEASQVGNLLVNKLQMKAQTIDISELRNVADQVDTTNVTKRRNQ